MSLINRTNSKRVHGTGLVNAGYMVVPIKAGAKYPGLRKWTEHRSTLQDVEKWARSSYYGGLGVLGEFNPGIDIDVQDARIVDKLIAWCQEHLGKTPVRSGNAPRVLIPCAPPHGGLGPDASAKYEDLLGVKHQIEIKAKGQQWVAYGIHPGTGNPYTWQGGNLEEYPAEFLPTLTGEKITALFKYFESIVPAEWVKLSAGAGRNKVGGLTPDGVLQGTTAFENYVPPLNIDADRVVSILGALSPDVKWRTVGMAMYHQFEGSDEGKEIFRRWSENSLDYDYDEIQARWPSWGAGSYGGRPVTFATVVAMYKEATAKTQDPTLLKKSDALSDWEKRFAMVDLEDSSEVHDIKAPIYKARRHTLRAFREQNAGYVHRFLTPEGETKAEPMVTAWQNSKNVRHFAGYTYQPGKPRFCKKQGAYGDDSLYINRFFFPPHDDSVQDPEALITPFMDLIKHLFPEPEERAWFVEWLARSIQYPQCRSFVTPINITSVTGTGRGILFDILRLLVGAHNTHDVSPDDMEGRFNGFLDKCLIACVQEIKANTGSKKYQTWERMKSLLADTVANIQEKGKDSYTAHVYANFLMFSNNIDALPIRDVNERRIYAMRGADRPLSNSEIDQIMIWKKEEKNISALFKYLKTYPVDLGHFKRAVRTATKEQMVTATAGNGAADLDDWLLSEAPPVFDYDYAAERLAEGSEEVALTGIPREVMRRSLLDKGYHSRRVRTAQGVRRYVYFKPGAVAPGDVKRLYDQVTAGLL